MWYVIVRESRNVLGVYPVPTEERAKVLAHCLGGFWRYGCVGVTDSLPTREDGIYILYPADRVDGKQTRAERDYCSARALAWVPGTPRY